MAPNEVLEALLELAERLGVAVRIEPFALKILGKGGLCRVEGRPVVLVDSALGLLEQIGVIGLSLGQMDLTAVAIQRVLIPYLKTGHGPIARSSYLKPLARVLPFRARPPRSTAN